MKSSTPPFEKLSSRRFIYILNLRRRVAVFLALCSFLWLIVGCQNVPADNQGNEAISSTEMAGDDSIAQPAVQNSVLDRASDNAAPTNVPPAVEPTKPDTRQEAEPFTSVTTPSDLPATETSNDPPSDPEDNDFLEQLQALSETEKLEMEREKELTDRLNAKTQAPDLYSKALNNEQKGDIEFQKGTQRGFLEAQKFYKAAKEAYKNAGEMARPLPGSELRQQAESARSSMKISRQKVEGRTELQSLPSYQNAEQYERLGESYMQQNNYAVAINAFQKAQTFFEEAATEKLNDVAAPTTPPTSKPAVPSDESPENAMVAQRKIKSLMNEYVKGLETFDLNGLLSSGFITKSEEKNWAQVFNNARDLNAEIVNDNIQIDHDRAQADFTVKISFYNTSQGRRDNFQYPKKWQLESANGNWKVVSLK